MENKFDLIINGDIGKRKSSQRMQASLCPSQYVIFPQKTRRFFSNSPRQRDLYVRKRENFTRYLFFFDEKGILELNWGKKCVQRKMYRGFGNMIAILAFIGLEVEFTEFG